MEVKPLLERDPDFIQYAKKMATALSGLPKDEKILKARELRKYRDSLTSDQKIEFDKTLQQPSMRATMERPKSMDGEWQNRPIPQEVIDQCKKLREAKTDEERAKLVNQRPLDANEVQTYESHRRTSKNTVGQSEESATTPELRNKAVEAFVHSPPAKLTPEERDKLIKLNGYDPPVAFMDETPEPDTAWDKFLKIFGIKKTKWVGLPPAGTKLDKNLEWEE